MTREELQQDARDLLKEIKDLLKDLKTKKDFQVWDINKLVTIKLILEQEILKR